MITKELSILDNISFYSRYITLPILLGIVVGDIFVLINDLFLRTFDIFTFILPFAIFILGIIIRDLSLEQYSKWNLCYFIILIIAIAYYILF